MKNITQKELDKTLKSHRKWLFSKEEGERANLEGVNLRGLNLEVANLDGANLQGANLREANLQYASLQEADLQGATLSRVNLQGASLQGANLRGANLHRAMLTCANLKSANLQRAILQEAQLESANLENANLKGANLRDVSAMRIRGIFIGSVSNVGTYNGSVTYVPSLNIVFAGCWQGNEEEFFAKCKEVQLENQFENGRELNLDIAIFMVEKLRKRRAIKNE